MKNRRNRAVMVIEILIALPMVFLLGILAVEFVEKYGFIVFPIGAAVYFVITIVVDKYFWRQSDELEQVLERKLSFVSKKSGDMQDDH
jgi:nitrate reductase NapE component